MEAEAGEPEVQDQFVQKLVQPCLKSFFKRLVL
jgi:hypothetical protein